MIIIAQHRKEVRKMALRLDNISENTWITNCYSGINYDIEFCFFVYILN
jgi:hypothetical protein